MPICFPPKPVGGWKNKTAAKTYRWQPEV
ncbi:autotransporter outer membrane beta-barrel domain-containing protein, partial [Neisseria gonorrhoeae]